ncbi:hypothetical protein [Aneurinibacillus danicus]|uniref:Uncharacterized protein n=1 Tax=Aneurinibacillus danicus TaxID=267746 RepID=A0A511VH09_9BACL|nr:hypothetical protein [Aneurinibacillus danicus]GEN36843.1 hypothetical protein ADA01nite_43030 [Aneurinibacillus danicus]
MSLLCNFGYLFLYLCILFGMSFSLFTLIEHTFAAQTGSFEYFVCLLTSHTVCKDFFTMLLSE